MTRIFCLLLIAQPLFAIDFHDPRALVASAIEKHPALVRLRAEAAALRERVAGSDALPNPMLMSGIQNKQIDLRDDDMMTMYMVGASQRFVRPGKRDARREAAELEARAAEQQLDSARAGIERDVLLAWYDVAAVDAQIASAGEVRVMIDAITDTARVRYEVGSSMQSDVIRAQLEASDLEHELITLRAARRAALARLLTFLDLPLDTDVPLLTLPESTAAASIEGAPTLRAGHPAIAALETDVARAETEIRLAQLERKPDFDLEAQYGMRPRERDMLSVVARVELPLRGDVTVEPRVREAILRRDAARARIHELRRSLTAALRQAFVAHEDATNQLRFHREVLVPQAQLAFESTLAAYQTGKTSFDAVLITETDYLRLRLQYYDFVARHAQAIVTYDALQKGATE
ncbi:MAG TPA: TolC family protein [Thermoanaerobaculia bacterium]